ncbi:hypothetical protein PBI_SCTP2_420 [Salicola phage SCTP-2]|nr:hypothetical protein PBI_SCTP2_420 [Salicola phage SCTP-2]
MDFWTLLAIINITSGIILGFLTFRDRDWLGFMLCGVLVIGQTLSMIY